MTLTNPKPLGWAYGEIFTSAQANSIATQLPYAVDGNAGGTYNNTNPIELTGTLEVGTLIAPDVSGPTAFDDDITVSGDTNTQDISATGDIDATGHVAAAGTVSGATGSFTNVTASATVAAATCQAGTVYATQALRLSTGGGSSYNANVTLTVGSTPQIITIDDGDLTNNRTWTISNTGAVDGSFFIINNLSTTRSITINSPSASPLTTVNNAPATTSDEGSGTINYARTSIILYRYASIWHFMKIQER